MTITRFFRAVSVRTDEVVGVAWDMVQWIQRCVRSNQSCQGLGIEAEDTSVNKIKVEVGTQIMIME